MRAFICDRCGDVLLDETPCRCRTPYDARAVAKRHREAVARSGISVRTMATPLEARRRAA
jgi:hypothetical protein